MFDLHADDVMGHRPDVIQARGVCMCGHRVAKHSVSGLCQGVPTGRMVLDRTVTETACSCTGVRPVLLAEDARKFQLSWRTAYPAHPLTVALRRAEIDRVEITWLIAPEDVRCEAPGCERTETVRPVYQPGTFRKVSVMACTQCVPVANGI
jgi:hypothetical protein